MNRKFGIVGIVVLALLLASTAVYAQSNRDRVKVASMPPSSGIYDRTLLRPDPNSIVDMPSTPQGGAGPPALAKAGPTDFPVQTLVEPGATLLTPRGAAMSSEKQIADRQIRRMIKRLD